jgi:hypothetical protein
MLYVSYASRARKSILAVMMAIVLIASFLTGSVPAAHAQGAPALFSDASAAHATADHAADVARSRYVNVNVGLLLDNSGRAQDMSALPEVTLNLFPDANYTGLVDRVEKTAMDSTSWIGRLAGVDGGYFYLVESSDGGFIAHVASRHGVYEVSSAGGNLYRVIQIDQSKLVDEPNEGRGMQVNGPSPVTDLGPTADSGARIDVMAVYTAAALAGEGSLPALKARIALALTETNQSYANAGITPRLRLVHIQQVTYAETGNISTDVARLAGTADGFMDNVHALRNAYGADMVSLIVENAGAGLCGIADAIKATAATAFDVVARNCMTGYYSFGHEFGHLQGARHDTFVDPSTTPYAFGHGFVNVAATEVDSWRTVMGYANACVAAGFAGCTRLQYWSNPANTFGGVAMGDSLSRNYQVLNNTAVTVANFRTQVVGDDFNSSFNGFSAGWTRVSGTWVLASSAFYVTAGAPNYWSSIKHTGKYGDLTFTARIKRSGTCTGCANNLIVRGNPATLRADKMWKSTYIFEYDNDGYFSVWNESATGIAVALKQWTFSPAVIQGNWNTLKVVAVGSLLRFFINGTLVWAGNNSSFTTGQVGIGMYRAPGTTGDKLYVDSASLWTTPTTADISPFADVAAGVTVPGGDITHGP